VAPPDPRTSVSGGVVLARVFEEAGLPDGLLDVLPGGPVCARSAAYEGLLSESSSFA